MDSQRASRILFGCVFVGLGLIGIVGGTFAPMWKPVPDGTPFASGLVLLTTLVALAAGVGLLFRRSAAAAALALTIFLIVWTLAFKFPFIVRAPLVEGSYQSNGENWVMIAAAWLLYIDESRGRDMLNGNGARRIVDWLYGLALIAFGLSHFFYLELTAPLVPHWLSAPVFWAYASAIVYLASGLAIATRLAPGLGVLLAAANITLISVLVWTPIVAAGHLSAMHWQETVMSIALTVASWVLASGWRRATATLHPRVRPNRSVSSDTGR